ncbi:MULTISPECIES: hypothetical protein [Brevibacterium]|uniref:Meckel syndrome type 1 protein n=1 Tax=Brevibacterium salitolerans TaxID=1403566 RepID=A0ABN2WBY8_9MICO|nr:hypothetical protein [Brevibacterium sp.]
MAEKFMTRRERREAEQRAKQAAEAAEAPAAQSAPSVPAAPPQPSTPPQPVVAPQPSAAPQQEPVAPAQPAASVTPAHSESAPSPRIRSQRSAPPVTVSGEAAPAAPRTPAPAPAGAPATPAPKASASEPPAPAAPAPSPEDFELPTFATRGERKRFLREHGLPVDIPTASIPVVLAERAAQRTQPVEEPQDGTSEEAAAPAPAADRPDVSESQPEAVEQPAQPEAAAQHGSAEQPEPVAQPEAPAQPEQPASPAPVSSPPVSPAPWAAAEPSVEEAAPEQDEAPAEDAARPEDTGPGEAAVSPAPEGPADEPSAGAPAEEAVEAPRVSRSSLFDVQSAFAHHDKPLADLAQRRIDSSPSGPDFATSSTAVITPAGRGDQNPPARRRTPVIQPPTSGNIRVVTGALPITPDPADGPADPPTTPIDAIDLPAEEQAVGPDGGAPAAGGASGAASTSAGQRRLSAGAEQWRGLGIDGLPDESDDVEGAELASPPVGPMSARSVTHEDGEILVGERGSMVPYIALGAAGVVALALVVIALFLLL